MTTGTADKTAHAQRAAQARWEGQTQEDKDAHAAGMRKAAADRREQERQLRAANVELLSEVRQALQALQEQVNDLSQRVAA